MILLADSHCDTASEALDRNEELYKNTCHIDLERLNKNKNHLQFFAAFIDPEKYKGFEMMRLSQIIDFLYVQAEKCSEHMAICKNYNEIQQAFQSNKTAAVISIENGAPLQGDISKLIAFYRLGIRSICLTWNYSNEIADGVKDSSMGRGLTAFGKEVVEEMNRLGMLVDVSHLSEKSFWDVMEIAKAPLMASHSNAKAICKHPRNLTDEQIKALSLNKGYIGINLYPYFLNDKNIASVDDIIRHIEHITSLAGEDHIGIGADFDGIESMPEEINGVEDIYKVFDRLAALNYSNSFLKKLAGENLLCLIKQILK